MNTTFRKTDLGTMNHGRCGSPNNCRYKGTTVAWEIMFNGEPMEIGFKTKKLASACVNYANSIDWDGDSDIEMQFYSANPEYIPDI